jgi:hypothetical protein
MGAFPKLKTGAVMQYPASRSVEYATQVYRFVDGSEQRYRERGAGARRWEIRLERLDEEELQSLQEFFGSVEGRAGSFAFTDPWDGVTYEDCSLENDEMMVEVSGEMRGQTVLVVRENRS